LDFLAQRRGLSAHDAITAGVVERSGVTASQRPMSR
jgi:hypothetical protein